MAFSGQSPASTTVAQELFWRHGPKHAWYLMPCPCHLHWTSILSKSRKRKFIKMFFLDERKSYFCELRIILCLKKLHSTIPLRQVWFRRTLSVASISSMLLKWKRMPVGRVDTAEEWLVSWSSSCLITAISPLRCSSVATMCRSAAVKHTVRRIGINFTAEISEW